MKEVVNIEQEKKNVEEILEYQNLYSKFLATKDNFIEKTKIRNQMEKIETRLLTNNNNLIRYFVDRYNKIEEFDDAMQIARLVFLNSIKIYNQSKQIKFSTYLGASIRNRFYQLSIQLNPYNKFRYEYKRIIDDCIEKGIRLTHDQIAKKMGLTNYRYAELWHMMNPIELDAEISDVGVPYVDTIQDDIDVEKTGIEHNAKDIILEAIDKFLKNDQKLFMKEFYYLNHDLTYISNKYGKSKQWVSQSIKKAEKKLAFYLLKNKMKDYYDKGERNISI